MILVRVLLMEVLRCVMRVLFCDGMLRVVVILVISLFVVLRWWLLEIMIIVIFVLCSCCWIFFGLIVVLVRIMVGVSLRMVFVFSVCFVWVMMGRFLVFVKVVDVLWFMI